MFVLHNLLIQINLNIYSIYKIIIYIDKMFSKYFKCGVATIMAVTSSVLTLNYIITDNKKNNMRLEQLRKI